MGVRAAIEMRAVEDDLAELERAYANENDSGVPSSWTYPYVQRRLVEAYDVLHRNTRTPGPQSYGSNWPSIFRDYAELVDWDELDRAVELKRSWRVKSILDSAAVERKAIEDRDIEETKDRRVAQPFADEIEKSDEALAWCARYLGSAPILADALQLWAFCQARDLEMAKLLRWRVLKAEALLERRRADEPDLEKRAKIARRDVMPDRVFTRKWLGVCRKEGATIIARELNNARVMVR